VDRKAPKEGLHQDFLTQLKGCGTGSQFEPQDLSDAIAKPLLSLSAAGYQNSTILLQMASSTNHRVRVAVTLGDPAGIGPEVIHKALASPLLDPAATFEILGDHGASRPGHPTSEGAHCALAALESAAAGALEGRFQAVVTGPIHKALMRSAGFTFPGHTEFFAERWRAPEHAMCLTGGSLTVALVTAHVPYRAVPELLTPAAIARTGRLLSSFLTLRLGRRPRIAVAGLNPHAGESGLLGTEEQDCISAGVQLLVENCDSEVSGPWPPDTLFHRTVSGEFDGVVCMYHDQGLIPLKLHAFHEGVNVTLGLPFPRTSPDHGTAFDLAAKGGANPSSMLAALNLAAELARKSRPPLTE
jgi:4-hydroxythreonine-4-phosphate dehydrogenase